MCSKMFLVRALRPVPLLLPNCKRHFFILSQRWKPLSMHSTPSYLRSGDDLMRLLPVIAERVDHRLAVGGGVREVLRPSREALTQRTRP